jgi:hypothetical protein
MYVGKEIPVEPGQILRVPRGWGSQSSRQSAHESGNGVSTTYRLPVPARKCSWYSFHLRGCVYPRAVVRQEELCQWKIPVTPRGIEPATFRLVAQYLNQLPPTIRISLRNNYAKKCMYSMYLRLQWMFLQTWQDDLLLSMLTAAIPLTLTGSSYKRISTPGVRSGQSQSLTALSSPDEARNRPSGEFRKLDICPAWASAIDVCSLWSRNDESGIRRRVPLEHALHS